MDNSCYVQLNSNELVVGSKVLFIAGSKNVEDFENNLINPNEHQYIITKIAPKSKDITMQCTTKTEYIEPFRHTLISYYPTIKLGSKKNKGYCFDNGYQPIILKII